MLLSSIHINQIDSIKLLVQIRGKKRLDKFFLPTKGKKSVNLLTAFSKVIGIILKIFN